MVQIDREILRQGEAALEQVDDETFYRAYGKRAFDLVLGTVLFLLAVPVILILALIVAVTSGWPPFYMATRVGKDGKTFRLWKLRTMVRDADRVLGTWRADVPDFEDQFVTGFKVQSDPRITLVGQFLRRTSLDELPQLWNVVRGDMSLVGPRPVVQDELSHYGPYRDRFLSVRPGLTGRWQVNGRNRITYPDRVWVELECCASSTLRGDLVLLAKTMIVPFRLSGH